MVTHTLKIHPKSFEPLSLGSKTFEVRKNDRGYGVDDLLHLKEWDPEKKVYTGRFALRIVTYVLHGPCYDGIVPEGVVVMGLSVPNKLSYNGQP